jgi:tetratricopeptide (TPR) repeat protein
MDNLQKSWTILRGRKIKTSISEDNRPFAPRRSPGILHEMSDHAVSISVEELHIPTYPPAQPQKNPMFLEKRVYQGSSGVVYPYPIVESIGKDKVDRTWTAIVLENEYLRIVLLPEIGGRVHEALDKTNGYHFIYYNRVIKPALVGLTGPWVSGGIEFNWPQHHRPSTFEPVDWATAENPDGSKTAWLSEIDRMFRMKATVGFTLFPGRAYLELSVRLTNRTSEPQTFLWWANPAVHVHEEYQSVFPPDVDAVMDHGKRDVSAFPMATGTYYKVDYSPGTDISWYKSIPAPTSYMAHHSDFDFLGSYDHRAGAGMVHVADHHIVPGKKLWTWGNGDFGRAWERHLTDEDGPYVELMCGAFTDNQPDFAWLQPGEEKRFAQVFLPYKRIGPAKNASRDAVVNLDANGGLATFGVYVTTKRSVTVELLRSGALLAARNLILGPDNPHVETVPVPREAQPFELMLRVSSEGTELVRYSPAPPGRRDLPKPAEAPPPPAEVASLEELFLIGLHLEQYRHATWEPEPYYREALRRDPGDSRSNNALGLLMLRRGVFPEAESFFRRAVERITSRNPNPYDGEPSYNLGLALRLQGRYDEAYNAFYKSVWNQALRSPGYFEVARIDCRRGHYDLAIEHAGQALDANRLNHRARHLLVACARKAGRHALAQEEARTALELDPMDLGVLYERFLMSGIEEYRRMTRRPSINALEIALDYAHAGLYEEAANLLSANRGQDPMSHYFLGWFASLQGHENDATAWFSQARKMPPDLCFPHGVESGIALQRALALDGDDARTLYFLGTYWYGRRRHREAMDCWERSRALDPGFPTVHRNLAMAYVNKKKDLPGALRLYARAFELDESDGRVLYEYDQLRRLRGTPPSERLELLDRFPGLVQSRNDLSLERITLLNILGRHAESLRCLQARSFQPWEGGEGKVVKQYLVAIMELTKQLVSRGRFAEAVRSLRGALHYPSNLGEGKLFPNQDRNVLWLLGLAHRGLGEEEEARQALNAAAAGRFQPSSSLYYNDVPLDASFYRGLALRALDMAEAAEAVFRQLEGYGREHENDEASVDYFAVSLPDLLVFDQDLGERNRAQCRFMIGLGLLGRGETERAASTFEAILARDPNNLDAVIHLKMARDASELLRS